MEKQINRNKNLLLRNNDLPDSNVNTTFKNYEVANSKKPSIINNSSNSQFFSDQTFQNNNMSILEYLSYSTVNSSSNSNYMVINTKKYKNKHSNNYFQSDSDSYTENSELKNMKQNTVPPKHTILHYTINDTTDSDSITSVSENSNNYTSNTDDNKSFPLNKPNNRRENLNHSKKYIQPTNNNITGIHTHIYKNTKFHNPPKKDNNNNKTQSS